MTLDPFFRILDLVGIYVFALSGSIAAARKQMDLYGSFVLAMVTALGGGIIRDVVLGITPVTALTDPLYLGIAFAGSISVYFLYKFLIRLHFPLRYLDAVGLGVFTVIGTNVSLFLGVPWPGAVLLGILSGTGGGMIRDTLCLEVPLVLQREVYAVAALLGGVFNVLLLRVGAPVNLSAGVSALIITAVRIISVVKDLHLPRAVWQTEDPDR
jgi:uncharacterized membrane protein YeiH